jgi:hypothetical protein
MTTWRSFSIRANCLKVKQQPIIFCYSNNKNYYHTSDSWFLSFRYCCVIFLQVIFAVICVKYDCQQYGDRQTDVCFMTITAKKLYYQHNSYITFQRMYRVYHYNHSQKHRYTVVKKWNQDEIDFRVIDSLNLPRDTRVKVMLVARPLLTPGVRKLCRWEYEVFTRGTCVRFRTLLCVEIFSCSLWSIYRCPSWQGNTD